MYRNIFRSRLETIIGDISLDRIKNAVEELIMFREENKDVVKQFLDKFNFKGIFQQHPLIGRILTGKGLGVWAHIVRRYEESHAYRRIQEKLNEILRRQEVEEKDLLDMKTLLRELRGVVIDFVERLVSDTKQGLRHIHAPGSVAKREARNLYFGEKLTDNDLYLLASRLCGSIAFGENIGIYSEDEDFMRSVKQLVESFGLGPSFKIEKDKLKEIGIQKHDVDHPHVVFLKFIMWLRKQIDVEENVVKRGICLSILNMLRSVVINVYFMPPDKEKWCTLSFPRLDFFINNWIQNDEARRKLETLVDNIDKFIKSALKKSRRKGEIDKVRNMISLFMSKYETLCRKLIEYGVPDFHALRNLMDIIIDLSIRYNIKLHFKQLILTT